MDNPTALQTKELLDQLLSGSLPGGSFAPWQIELLLDVEACAIPRHQRYHTFRRYVRALQHNITFGVTLKFADFVAAEKRLRKERGARFVRQLEYLAEETQNPAVGSGRPAAPLVRS